MSGFGSDKLYEISGENTEWEDILIKKGITTQENVLLKKGINPEEFLKKKEIIIIEDEIITKQEICENATLEDLDELEDDDPDDSIIQQYREKRLQELQHERTLNRFGSIVEISKDDWIKEVTEASNSCWVVVLLYSNSVVECGVMENVLNILSKKFMKVKFLKIRSTSAIENWPDMNLPTIFVYHDGELAYQLLTLKSLGGSSMTSDDFEWWLSERNIVESELNEDPREYRPISNTTTVLKSVAKQSNHYYSDEDI